MSHAFLALSTWPTILKGSEMSAVHDCHDRHSNYTKFIIHLDCLVKVLNYGERTVTETDVVRDFLIRVLLIT